MPKAKVDTSTDSIHVLRKKLKYLPTTHPEIAEFYRECNRAMKALVLERDELRDQLTHCEHQLWEWSDGWAAYFSEGDRTKNGVFKDRAKEE